MVEAIAAAKLASTVAANITSTVEAKFEKLTSWKLRES